jgi:N-methylhydantoinase A
MAGAATYDRGGQSAPAASRQAGIETVLAPKASPTFSALGALAAKPSIDEERSCVCPADAPDLARLAALWPDLGARAEKYFADAGFAADQVSAKHQLNMRYPGQNFSLTFDVAAPSGVGDLSSSTAR